MGLADHLARELRREIGEDEASINGRSSDYNQKQEHAIERCAVLLEAAWPRELPAQVAAVQTLLMRIRLAARRRACERLE